MIGIKVGVIYGKILNNYNNEFYFSYLVLLYYKIVTFYSGYLEVGNQFIKP